MIADDSDAVTVIFHRMMRAALRAEKVGEDTLGRTVDLARSWGTSPEADARLATALRALHGEPAAPDDRGQAADGARSLAAATGLAPEPDPRRPDED